MTNAPVAQSALHETYKAHKASLESRGGWQVATSFDSPDVESGVVHGGVGFGECIGLGVLDIVGRDIAKLGDKVGAGKLLPGSAVAAKVKGVKDARWCQLTRHHARLLVALDDVAAAMTALKSEGSCAHVTDISSGMTTFALVGPRSNKVLPRLTRIDLDPRVHDDKKLVMTGAVGIPITILRWDRSGTLVYEMTVGRDLAEYFWDSVMHNAEDLGLKPLGLDSLAQFGVVGGGVQA
jgi:glycine cleavage system aminomethyltransferase T